LSKVYIEIEGMIGRSFPERGTLTIDRASRTITLKPFRSRVEYTLPLKDIAEHIAFKVNQTKALESRTKRAVRRVNRGLLRGR